METVERLTVDKSDIFTPPAELTEAQVRARIDMARLFQFARGGADAFATSYLFDEASDREAHEEFKQLLDYNQGLLADLGIVDIVPVQIVSPTANTVHKPDVERVEVITGVSYVLPPVV